MHIIIYKLILFYLKMFREQMKYKSPDKYEREKDYKHLTFLIETLTVYIDNYSNFTNKYYAKILKENKQL